MTFLYIRIYIWSCCCHITVFWSRFFWNISSGSLTYKLWMGVAKSVPTSPTSPHHIVLCGLGKGEWGSACESIKNVYFPVYQIICSHSPKDHYIGSSLTLKLRYHTNCVLFLSEWSAGCPCGPDTHIQPWYDSRTATCSAPQHGYGVPPES